MCLYVCLCDHWKALTVCYVCMYVCVCVCEQEVAQSVICYWRKDELRKELKGLKKKVDDVDKARKAAVMNEVHTL